MFDQVLAEVSFDQVWSSLAAAGPLALVLAIAVYVLWVSNKEERERHAKQEEEERERHAKQEEADRVSLEVQRSAFGVTLDTMANKFASTLEAQTARHMLAEERESTRHAAEEKQVRDELSGIFEKVTAEMWFRRTNP